MVRGKRENGLVDGWMDKKCGERVMHIRIETETDRQTERESTVSNQNMPE